MKNARDAEKPLKKTQNDQQIVESKKEVKQQTPAVSHSQEIMTGDLKQDGNDKDQENKIEKVNEESKEETSVSAQHKKKTKKRWWKRTLLWKSFSRNATKIKTKIRGRNVNAREKDWHGPIICTIVKDVSYWDKKQTCSHFEETIVESKHEAVKDSWERSLTNLLKSRKAIVNNSKKEAANCCKKRPKKKSRKKFKVYKTEKLIVETRSVRNQNLKSIYSIVHIKKSRPVKNINYCRSCHNPIAIL